MIYLLLSRYEEVCTSVPSQECHTVPSEECGVTYEKECGSVAKPYCRVVYEKVCPTGGYSPGSYSHIGAGAGPINHFISQQRLFKREADEQQGVMIKVTSSTSLFIIPGEDREGKSYGGPHRGNLGIVPAAVGVAPGPGVVHQVYGMVQGKVDITFLV